MGKTHFDCWKCGSEAVAIQKCPTKSCGALQPLQPDTTYFDVLLNETVESAIKPKSVKPVFQVNVSNLRANWRKLQQSVHPDVYSMKEEVDYW